jgi:hypothetical protein
VDCGLVVLTPFPQVSTAQGFTGSQVLAAGRGNAATGRKMCLRGGGPVMGVEVQTTRPGNGKDFPKKVRILQVQLASVLALTAVKGCFCRRATPSPCITGAR